MKKILVRLIVSATALFSLNTAVSAQPSEAVSLPFGLDSKDWELGWQKQSEGSQMLEFVPKGQTVENWKEIVTVQFYPRLQKLSAQQFMDGFLAHLRKDEPKAKVRPISSSYDNALVEWSVLDSKSNPDQYEVDRVIKGEQGLHMIHYAVKTNEWSESERTKWLKFLDTVKLKKTE